MKPVLFLVAAVGLLLSGCSYEQGTAWEVRKIVYRGGAVYKIVDSTDLSADPPRLSLRIRRSLADRNKKQNVRAEMRQVVPYRLGSEMGNFFVGIANVALTPILVPMMMLFPSEDDTVGAYFATMGHNLNLFQANPNNDDTLFRTTIVRRPTGVTDPGDWMAVIPDTMVPLADTPIVFSLPVLGFAKEYTTDAMGNFEVDLAPLREKIGERKSCKAVIEKDGKKIAEMDVFLGRQ